MEIFEQLLNNANENYKAGKFEKAQELTLAAIKYVRAMLEAKKLTSPAPPLKT